MVKVLVIDMVAINEKFDSLVRDRKFVQCVKRLMSLDRRGRISSHRARHMGTGTRWAGTRGTGTISIGRCDIIRAALRRGLGGR